MDHTILQVPDYMHDTMRLSLSIEYYSTV